MSTISARRFFIVVVLLITAVAGALLRIFSTPQSTPYYLGTLFMVMWVPVVGNVISFIGNKLAPKASVPPAFSPAMPFVSQVAVELKLHSGQGLDLPRKEPDGRIHCLFIVGTEGFSARVSLLETHIADAAVSAQAQFLSPAAALPKFPIGTTFQLMQGSSGIGTGQVVS